MEQVAYLVSHLLKGMPLDSVLFYTLYLAFDLQCFLVDLTMSSTLVLVLDLV